MRKNKRKKLLILMFMGLSSSLGLYGCNGNESAATENTATENTAIENAAENTAENSNPQGTEVPVAPDTADGEHATVPTEKSSLKLTFSKSSGVYDGEFNLEITCDGKADIYYTTDGSNPATSTSRILYNTSVKVTDRRKDENYVTAVVTTKYSDTYRQSLIKELDCETQTSRPCIVYIDGEYWGLYVLQEDYSQEYFETTHGVNKEDVVLYKGDAEEYEIGYKLDLGELPEGVTDESYYFTDLLNFFHNHSDLSEVDDYEEFAKLVDVESARDYFAVQIWINNKWDWPGKNWSLWKTVNVEKSNPYADGRWRFCFYDVEFGGVSGSGDAFTNTIKEDNYQKYGMLDMNTKNPAVLIFAYLMTNKNFRNDYENMLQGLSEKNFSYETASAALNVFKNTYSPLYNQFFARYPGTGSADNSNFGGYASYQCIKDFLKLRAGNIQPMVDFINDFYNE